ncbi:hypothetical protein Nmel_000530 [Mimus melanotis]
MGNQRSNMVCTVTMPKAKPSQINVYGMTDTGQRHHHLYQHVAFIMSYHSSGICSFWHQRDHTELLEQQSCIDNPEGQTATTQPYITAAPLNLHRPYLVFGGTASAQNQKLQQVHSQPLAGGSSHSPSQHNL